MSESVPTRTRRSVTKDISPSLMMEMRKQGLTNKEIAEQCGCCYATVLSYIGKAPFRGEGRKKDIKSIPRLNTQSLQVPPPEKRPFLREKKVTMQGEAAEFTLYIDDGHIDFQSDQAIVGGLTADTARRLSQELYEAAELLSSYQRGGARLNA